MQVSYELNVTDYTAACVAHHNATRNRGAAERTGWWAWLLLAIFVAAAGFAFALALAEIDWELIRQGVFPDEIRELLPWFVLAMMQLVYTLSPHVGRRVTQCILLAVGVLGLGLAILVLRHATRTDKFSMVIPWLFLTSTWVAAWRVLVIRTSLERLWRNQESEHGQKNFSWDQAGFTVHDTASQHAYQWRTLKGWQETPDLLLLYIADIIFLIVPKRAFPDEPTLVSLQEALIEATKKFTPGFPVIMNNSSNPRYNSAE